MKNYKRKKLLISFLITCAVICGLSFSAPQQVVFAAATSTSSNKQLTVDALKEYSLFPNGNGITDIDDYFGYYCADTNARVLTNTDMLEHRAGKGVAGSYKVGHFFSDILLPQNYINAGKNGALIFGSSAYLSSEDDPFWGVSLDSYVEDVIMEIAVGTGASNSYSDFVTASSTSVTEEIPRDFVLRTIDNWVPETMGDFLRLHFYTKQSSSNNIIMKIKEPKISISTNDTAKPVITSYSYDEATRYQSNKRVYINVSDAGSGINYVTVNGVNAELYSISEDTKTATFVFEVDGCNTYNIEVFDNVGNLTADTYTTKKVTTSVKGNGTFTGDLFTFAGDTVTLSAVADEGNKFVGYILNGSFVKTEQSTFDITVEDNIEIVAYFKQIATFVLNETEYWFTGSELSLDYSVEPQNLLVTATFYKNSQSVSFKDVGEYQVDVAVDDENYIFFGSYAVVVNRQVEITVDDADVIYNAEQQGVVVTTDCPVNYDIVYSLNGQVVNAQDVVDAGTYDYVVTINQQYYFGSCSGSFTIKNKEVSVILQDLSHTYDGQQKQVTVICDYDYQITYNQLLALPVNAGSYAVKVDVTQKNYTGSANGTLTIATRKATITADNKTSVYGDSLKTLTCTLKNVVETDTIDVELSATILNQVGSYEIAVKPVENSNYDFTYVKGSYKVTPRKITICANNQSKIYGEQDPLLDYFVEEGNLVNSDVLSGNLERAQGEDAGQYSILQGTLNNENYDIEFVEGVFSILTRRVVVQIQNLTKTYGDVDQDFTYQTIYGSFATPMSLDLVREIGENVGQYKIYLNEFENGNYDLTALDATLTIVAKPITICADQITTVYGEDLPLSYQITDGSLAGEDILQGSLNREQGTNVGTYKIDIGTIACLNPNYTISFVENVYTIQKRPITIKAVNSSKVYGEDDGKIEYEIVSGSLAYDDQLSGSLSRVAGEVAGKYTILQGTLNNDNYDISLQPCYYTIEKRPVCVVAHAKSKVYGQTDCVLTYQVEGLIAGDIVTVELLREVGEDAGEYQILLNQFSNANYFVKEYTPATFVIKCANIPFEAGDKTFVYDGNAHIVDVSKYANFNFEVSYKDSNGMQVAEPIDADTYIATISFANNKNYNDKNYSVAITIKKQFVNITVDTEIFIFNGQNLYPTYYLNYDVNSFVNFAGEHSEVGVYDYTIVVHENNYFGEVSGTMEIIANPVYTNEQGDSLVYKSDKFDKNATVNIGVNNQTEYLEQAKQTLKPVITNIDVQGIYCFEASNSQIVNSNYVANLKLEDVDAEKLKIFEINEFGNIREVDFTYADGYASFNICDLNSTIFVTTENEIIKRAIAGSVIGVSVLLITIFAIFGRKIALVSFINKLKFHKKKKQQEEASNNQ
ncbi:MAG: MBG domain-containing protein [Christensenellales bacterium]